MDKTKLMEMGLSGELADKVMEALDGAYVTKSRFNEVNTALQEIKGKRVLQETALSQLKSAETEIERFKSEIQTAAREAETREQEFSETLKKARMDAAVDLALMEAKAKKPETVRPLLAPFLQSAEWEEKCDITALKNAVQVLAEKQETKYLFHAGPEGCFEGFIPGESRDEPGGKGFALEQLSYSELCESFS